MQAFSLAIPQFHRTVTASRSNGVAIWTEGYVIDRIFVLEGMQAFFLTNPQFRCIVLASRSNGVAISTEGYVIDPFVLDSMQ
jgi:hypothetical protein